MVSRPTYLGGLGFSMKWNMGWMNDTLSYIEHEPVHRRYHHNMLTFGQLYSYTENFMLPFSHDEVVHGKRSLLDKMPGDPWQKFANLRALYAYQYAHPGKKLLFMGGEFGQWNEWSERQTLDWIVSGMDKHAGLRNLVHDLNHLYRSHPALHAFDFPPRVSSGSAVTIRTLPCWCSCANPARVRHLRIQLHAGITGKLPGRCAAGRHLRGIDQHRCGLVRWHEPGQRRQDRGTGKTPSRV
jgi:hypothetical protein